MGVMAPAPGITITLTRARRPAVATFLTKDGKTRRVDSKEQEVTLRHAGWKPSAPRPAPSDAPKATPKPSK